MHIAPAWFRKEFHLTRGKNMMADTSKTPLYILLKFLKDSDSNFLADEYSVCGFFY